MERSAAMGDSLVPVLGFGQREVPFRREAISAARAGTGSVAGPLLRRIAPGYAVAFLAGLAIFFFWP